MKRLIINLIKKYIMKIKSKFQTTQQKHMLNYQFKKEKDKRNRFNCKVNQNRQKYWRELFHFERIFKFSKYEMTMKHQKRKKELILLLLYFWKKIYRIYNRILIFVIDRFRKFQTRYEVNLILMNLTIQFSYIDKSNKWRENFDLRIAFFVNQLRILRFSINNFKSIVLNFEFFFVYFSIQNK